MAEPPVPADGNPSTDDTSEITDTDDSTAVDQPQAKKRWADLFNETEAKVEKPVEEDNSKYTVFIPHILEIIEEQKRMAEQLTIDDYTPPSDLHKFTPASDGTSQTFSDV